MEVRRELRQVRIYQAHGFRKYALEEALEPGTRSELCEKGHGSCGSLIRRKERWGSGGAGWGGEGVEKRGRRSSLGLGSII